MPEGVPRLTAVGVNYRILGSAALAAIACGLFIGLGPATYLTTPNLAGALQGMPSGRRRPHLLQTAFIVGEVAVAVVLVVGSGLFVASFIRLMRVDLGFDHRGVAAIPCVPASTCQTSKPGTKRISGPGAAHRRHRAASRGTGVESAAALSGDSPRAGHAIESRREAATSGTTTWLTSGRPRRTTCA